MLGVMDDVTLLRIEGGKANALTPAVLDTIERSIGEFEAGPARAAVIVGYERFFSAGLPLPLLIDLDRAAMKTFMERFGDVMQRVFACPKPLVAAMNGHAIAGGYVLALQCDWRVLVDADARVGLNETQLGIGLPSSVLEPLKLAVPPASLVPIAYEGRLFSPPEALALGLVHELAPLNELEERAVARAQALATVPSSAVAQVKLGLRRAAIESITRHSAEETERWLDTWFSEAARARLTDAISRLKR
jgi:enoyl-CoA hydratase/carnithine racemase